MQVSTQALALGLFCHTSCEHAVTRVRWLFVFVVHERCDAGKYSGAGSGSCTRCDAGRYSGAGSSSCASCGAGKYSAARSYVIEHVHKL